MNKLIKSLTITVAMLLAAGSITSFAADAGNAAEDSNYIEENTAVSIDSEYTVAAESTNSADVQASVAAETYEYTAAADNSQNQNSESGSASGTSYDNGSNAYNSSSDAASGSAAESGQNNSSESGNYSNDAGSASSSTANGSTANNASSNNTFNGSTASGSSSNGNTSNGGTSNGNTSSGSQTAANNAGSNSGSGAANSAATDSSASSQTNTAETGSEQSLEASEQSQRVSLENLPLQIKAELPEHISAGEIVKIKVEIKNISNNSLGNITLKLTSKDSRYYITSFEKEEEAQYWLQTCSTSTLTEKEIKEQIKTDQIDISSLYQGETYKAEIIIIADKDINIDSSGLKATALCEFDTANAQYICKDEWKFTVEKSTDSQDAQEQAEDSQSSSDSDEQADASSVIADDEEEIADDSDDQEDDTDDEQSQTDDSDDNTDGVDTGSSDTTDSQDASADGQSEDSNDDEAAADDDSDNQDDEQSQTDDSDDNTDDHTADAADSTLTPEIQEEDITETMEAMNSVAEEEETSEDEMETFDVILDEDELEEYDEYYDEEYSDDWTYYYSDSYETQTVNTATPHILVKSYAHNKTINTGDEFVLQVTLLNTSQKLSIEGAIINIETSDSLSLANGTNTLFINNLEAGATSTQTINLVVSNECKENIQEVKLSISYEYVDNSERKEGTSTESISIPVTQKARLELKDPEYDEMEAGTESVISVSYINKGYTALNNMEAVISLENADSSSTQNYIGNVESGASGTIDFLVTPEIEGEYTGTITLTYEDSSQKEVSEVIPLEFYATTAYVEDYSDTESYEDIEIEEASAFNFTPIICIAGGVALAAAGTFFILKKKKKAKADIEVDDDWFNEQK